MKTIEVAAAVIIKNGKIFCAKRSTGGETAGKWEFPGGKIEKGESPEEALTREIFEELDVIAEVKNFFMSVPYSYTDKNIILHSYICTVKDENIKLTEHTASKWITKDEIDNINWAAADKFIAEKLKTIPEL